MTTRKRQSVRTTPGVRRLKIWLGQCLQASNFCSTTDNRRYYFSTQKAEPVLARPFPFGQNFCPKKFIAYLAAWREDWDRNGGARDQFQHVQIVTAAESARC